MTGFDATAARERADRIAEFGAATATEADLIAALDALAAAEARRDKALKALSMGSQTGAIRALAAYLALTEEDDQ